MVNLAIPFTTATGATQAGSSFPMIAILGFMLIAMYFLMIRPQKKREKKEALMRNNVQIGDEVATIGGIIGIVFSIKEDTVVIETGGDRSKIRIRKAAIAQNLTIHEEAATVIESKDSEEK